MPPERSRVSLSTAEANRLRKWASLWLDLLHVSMVLHERQSVPDKPSNAFVRRALWESAVVSYGRMEASNKRRALTHEDLLAAGGEAAVELHAEIMGWRDGHVAHRYSPDFEVVEVRAEYMDDEVDLVTAIISTAVGPRDDAVIARRFREHVQLLQDTLWQRYLAPIGQRVAGQPAVGSDDLPTDDDGGRLQAALNLWTRQDGTGL